MKWSKLGHVYVPDGRLPWARSYAANPVAEHIEGDLFRIYFSTRDDENRSSIGWIEIDINEPARDLARVADQPVLTPGRSGHVRRQRCSIGCIVPVGEQALSLLHGLASDGYGAVAECARACD